MKFLNLYFKLLDTSEIWQISVIQKLQTNFDMILFAKFIIKFEEETNTFAQYIIKNLLQVVFITLGFVWVFINKNEVPKRFVCCITRNSLRAMFVKTRVQCTYVFLTLFFCGEIKSCCNLCFPQQIRPHTTVQFYLLWKYYSVTFGFNMNNRCHTLPAVYTMLV